MVLKVIRSIAEQTNLLALNVAIEAAREVDRHLLNIRDFSVQAQDVAMKTFTTTRQLNQLAGNFREMMKSFVI